MTNEEAIKILKGIREEAGAYEEAVCYVGSDEDIEALDMAIREMTILGNSGIVNCCGCTHWESDGGSMMVCDLWDAPMNDFDYCSYGERGDTE